MRIICCMMVLLGALTASAQDEGSVSLRPIDRATVRILSLVGMRISTSEGRRTHTTRSVADPEAIHGSGVAIAPDLVLTAGHVVWGAEAWVVLAPGSTLPIAARPVSVDPERDLAVLAVDRPLDHHVTIPAPHSLTLSEHVSASGYPLDVREPTPAAVSGEVSRVTRAGALHLAMLVNPGHSGGPVIDREGRLVGIISARGRLEAGVEGLVIAVGMPHVRTALARVPSQRPSFTDSDRDLASAITLLVGVEAGPLAPFLPRVDAIMRRAVTVPGASAERDIIVAALAWNTLIDMLEAARAPGLSGLSGNTLAQAQALLGASRALARRAIDNGPHIRRQYHIVRTILLGHVDALAQRPPQFP